MKLKFTITEVCTYCVEYDIPDDTPEEEIWQECEALWVEEPDMNAHFVECADRTIEWEDA